MSRNGYFDRRSMAARALRHRAIGLTYGQRALVVGATHPVLFTGTARHTGHRREPWTRLALTARLFEAVFLGDRAEADRALAFTARRHAGVRGVTDVHGGPRHPVGTPYDAARGDLMWWTAAFTLDAVETMHDLLVRPLTPGEREGLLADFIEWAVLFGMPRSAGPSGYPQFRAAMEHRLDSGEAYLTEEARLVGRHLAGVAGYPLPGPAGVLGSPALSLLVVGSLPRAVRELYGFAWDPARQAAFLAGTRAIRLAHHRLSILPRTPLLTGRSREGYRAVAATEQRRLRRGLASIPGVSDVERIPQEVETPK